MSRRRTPELAGELMRAARRRARVAGVLFALTLEEVRRLVRGCVCEYCGELVESGAGRGPKPHSPTLDRVWPKLGYVPGNVVLACWRCNSSKRDRTLQELERLVVGLRRVVSERLITHHHEETRT